jgi:hypothetical protein
VEARVRAWVNPCGICGRSGTGTRLSTSSSVFSCQYQSTVARHAHVLWGMNNRPVGGRSSETQSHPIDMNISLEESILRS